MTENTFNTEESNANINSPQYYVDDDGSFKFISPVISSSNFDGSVPVFEGSASVSDLISGMYIQINGTDFSPIVNISKDDPGLEDSATTDVSITYLDNQNEVQTAVYNSSDIVTVRYENWDEKYLGTQGWLLTYGGNAIFSNVGVRGDLEATTLDVGGSDGITYDGNTVTIGASVVINAPVTFNGSGSYVTYNYLSASYADLSELATSGTTIINGGNITTGAINADLITTGFLSGSRINGGIISGQSIFGGSITGTNINTSIFTLDAPTTANPATIIGSERSIGGGLLSNISFNFKSGYSTFTHNGKSWTVDQNVNTTSIIRDQFYAYTSQDPFRSFIMRSGDLINNTTSSTINGAFIELQTNSTGATVLMGGNSIASYGAWNHSDSFGATSIAGNGSGLSNLNAGNIATGTLPSGRLSGTYGISITGNATTATTATRATNANNLDSSVTGGARINGSGVIVTNVGITTTTDYLRRDGSNTLKATNSSTRKIKTDISPLEGMTVLGLDVVKFKYIDGYLDKNDQRVDTLIPGFIAEQVYEEIPIAVDLDENGEPKNWNDRIIISIMVKTIQDQQKLIEDLQDRVLQLESQLGVTE